jgi:hypothetical protein
VPQTTSKPDLWTLVRDAPWIDPNAMLEAVHQQLRSPLRDFRTRLLIRDALHALEKHCGITGLRERLDPDVADEANRIRNEDLGQPGFPNLELRMADVTDADTITQFFRELGSSAHEKITLNVGGSSALILRNLLLRHTDDIDAVDEVPASLRQRHDLLDRLTSRYRLHLAHFQSHYLPQGWQQRLTSFRVFDKLAVFLVDPIDIFVGKLFSKREKDLDDLRLLKNELDRETIEGRIASSAQGFLTDSTMRPLGEKNWYVLFGDPLPA